MGALATVNPCLLHMGDNSTIDTNDLGVALDKVGKDEYIIMAVQPIQAHDIWRAAQKLV